VRVVRMVCACIFFSCSFVLPLPYCVCVAAAGLVGMLEEEDDALKAFALTKLDAVVDQFWAEVAESLTKMCGPLTLRTHSHGVLTGAGPRLSEVLYEDEGFAQRQLAALVLAKVYYHLGAYDNALAFALGAGTLFDVHGRTEFVETVVGTPALTVPQQCVCV
jgi:26S proteasome regulatory subunit N2